MRAGDIRRRDVGVAPQATALAGQRREREHPARPLDVDRPGLLERQRERHRRGDVNDVPDARCDLTAPLSRQTEVRRQQIGRDRVNPALVPSGTETEQVPQHR